MATTIDQLKSLFQKAKKKTLDATTIDEKLGQGLRSFSDRAFNTARVTDNRLRNNLQQNAGTRSYGQAFGKAFLDTPQTMYNSLQKTQITKPFGNLIRSTVTPLSAGAGNYFQGVNTATTAQGGLAKLKGGLQALKGGGQVAAGINPLTYAATSTNTLLPQGVTKRLLTGGLRGFTQTGINPETEAKNINTPLGSFDPVMGVGEMVGFVKNPINAKLFKGTEKILPTAQKTVGKWLGSNSIRGAIEQIALDLPEMPDNMNAGQKAEWLAKTIGVGAVSELVGQGVMQGSGKALKSVGNTKAGKVTQEQVGKLFDYLATARRRNTIPVRRSLSETVPMWREKLSIKRTNTPEDKRVLSQMGYGSQSAAGGLAGAEPYQDENGNWKMRFNPEKAALGIAAMGGIKAIKNGNFKLDPSAKVGGEAPKAENKLLTKLTKNLEKADSKFGFDNSHGELIGKDPNLLPPEKQPDVVAWEDLRTDKTVEGRDIVGEVIGIKHRNGDVVMYTVDALPSGKQTQATAPKGKIRATTPVLDQKTATKLEVQQKTAQLKSVQQKTSLQGGVESVAKVGGEAPKIDGRRFRVFNKSGKVIGKVDGKNFEYAEINAKKMFGGEYGSLMTDSQVPRESMIPPVAKSTPLEALQTEARTPKTVRIWNKSKFSNDGAFADIPVIRKEENITLYQGGKAGDNRQFWTPDKKYAEQFGNVKEKTGTFYKVDNGNTVTDVYVEAPTQATAPKVNISTVKAGRGNPILESLGVDQVAQVPTQKLRIKQEIPQTNQASAGVLDASQQAIASQTKQATQKLSDLLGQQTTSQGKKLTVQDVASEDIIQQAKSDIGVPPEDAKKSVGQVLKDTYTQWVNRYAPIERASAQAKKVLKIQGAELRPEYDPVYTTRRLTGAGGIADARYQTELKPIIKEIDDLGIEKSDMDVYLAHKRMAGFGDVGREIYGTDPAKSRQIISALEAKYPQITGIADKLYAYQDRGLRELADSGFISQDGIKAMQSQNPNYAPLYRVMDLMDDYLGLPTRKTMQGTNPILKIKGSDKKILSPVESIIGNTLKQRLAIEKNNVARSIIGLQDVTDMGFKKTLTSGNDTITVWRDGKKEFWQVGADIAETAKGLNEESTNALLKILQAPAQLLRQGATGRNPDFMIPNIVRDQLDAGITSKYGYIPFIDYTRGLIEVAKKDINTRFGTKFNTDIYDKWANSGAMIDLGELSGKKSIQQSFDEKASKKGLFSWLTAGLDAMGRYSEQPTRVGLFKKAYQKTGNEMLAMLESRDSTVDFARMGSKMKVANSVIPFLNVGVQGFDKLIRSIKNNPGKVALNMGIYGALPAISTTLYNLQNFPEEYSEIPQYEKDANFVLVNGRNEDGTVNYFTIPKGNVLPVVSNPIESFINYVAGTDQQTFGQFATQFISSTLPVVGDGSTLKEVGVKTIGSNLPQLIKPVTENLINKSFWKYDQNKQESKEIVPYYLKNKPAYEQSYDWTPQTYKTIGAVLNVSPLQVQNIMEGYLAGYIKVPNQIIDGLTKLSNGEEISRNDMTILRRFSKTTYPTNNKKPEKEVPVPSMMERVTGKVSASDGTAQPSFVERLTGKKSGVKASKWESYFEVPEYSALPEATNQQKALKEDKRQKIITSVMGDEDVAAEEKLQVLSKLGENLTTQDFEYYQVAALDNDVKTGYVLDEIANIKGAERLEFLAELRKPVVGKMILADGVIDDLYDQDLITSAQKKYLKSLDYEKDPKTGKYALKKGSGKKGKKIKIGSTPTLKKVSIKAPQVAQMAKIDFKIPTAQKVPIRKASTSKPRIKLKDAGRRLLSVVR